MVPKKRKDKIMLEDFVKRANIVVYTTKLENMSVFKDRKLGSISGITNIRNIIKESIPARHVNKNFELLYPETKHLKPTRMLEVAEEYPFFKKNAEGKVKSPLVIEFNKSKTIKQYTKRTSKSESKNIPIMLIIIFHYNDTKLVDLYQYDNEKKLAMHSKFTLAETELFIQNNNKKKIYSHKICCWFLRSKTINSLEQIFTINLSYIREAHKCLLSANNAGDIRCTCCCKPDLWTPENCTNEQFSKPNLMSEENISTIVQQILQRFKGLKLDIIDGVVRVISDNEYINSLNEFDLKILQQILLYAQQFVNDFTKVGTKNIDMNQVFDQMYDEVKELQSPSSSTLSQPICQILNTYTTSNESTNNNLNIKEEVKDEVHEVKDEVHEVKDEVHEVEDEVHEVIHEVKVEDILEVKDEFIKPNFPFQIDDIENTIPTTFISKKINVIPPQDVAPLNKKPEPAQDIHTLLLNARLAMSKASPYRVNQSKPCSILNPLVREKINSVLLNEELLSCANNLKSLLNDKVNADPEEFILGV